MGARAVRILASRGAGAPTALRVPALEVLLAQALHPRTVLSNLRLSLWEVYGATLPLRPVLTFGLWVGHL